MFKRLFGKQQTNNQEQKVSIKHAKESNQTDDISAKYRVWQTANDEHVCDECASNHRLVLSIDEAPATPHPDCTSPDGCRCWAADFYIDSDELDAQLVEGQQENQEFQLRRIQYKKEEELELKIVAQREKKVKALELNPVCPNCQESLEKKPKRKKKCPSCLQPIYVRQGVLYSEEGLEVYEALTFLENDGVFDTATSSVNDWDGMRQYFGQVRSSLSEQFGGNASVGDTVWRILNNRITEETDLNEQFSVQISMVKWIKKEGKDLAPYTADIWSALKRREANTTDTDELYDIYGQMAWLAYHEGIDTEPYEKMKYKLLHG